MTGLHIRYLFFSLLTFSALLFGENGLAATEGDGAEEGEWVTWVAPYLWGLSLNGDAQVGDKTADVDVSFSDILDDINVGAMGFLDGRKDRIGYFINPIYSRLTAKENVDGEKVDVTNDSAILAIGGYYRWIDTSVTGRNGGGTGRLVVEPYGGVRWTYLRVEVDVEGEGQGDESENWLDPIIGSRLMYVWDSRWDVALAADVGGFGIGSDSAWNMHLLVGYRLQLFGRDAIIRGGYRALHQEYETGSGRSTFKWDVTQEGPIAGIALKF
ncbi:MAG: hypothetical protein P8L39_07500 [Halioglobus sp.]|nr:hypothetical protein [Halioglobus sp.]